MEISDEFKENSIFDEFLLKTLKEDFCQEGSVDIFYEVSIIFFEQADICIKEYPNSVQLLKNRNYSLARKAIYRFDNFHSSVIVLRKTIRSLLAGMIITSEITDENAIADYKKKWEPYENNERSKYPFYYHHQVIYQQFKKVTTLEELAEFNENFHQYLVEMAFKLAEIIIRRMSYTIGYMKNDEVLKESCHQAAVQLQLVRDEIEKLKENPLLPK